MTDIETKLNAIPEWHLLGPAYRSFVLFFINKHHELDTAKWFEKIDEAAADMLRAQFTSDDAVNIIHVLRTFRK